VYFSWQKAGNKSRAVTTLEVLEGIPTAINQGPSKPSHGIWPKAPIKIGLKQPVHPPLFILGKL